MASRSGATEVDLLAAPAWTTVDPSGHGLSDPSPCKGKPDVWISPNPRGARHDGRQTCARERVGNPSPPWHRVLALTGGSELGGVPTSAGNDDAGMRLLHRRHGAAPALLRAVLHRDRRPTGLPFRRHCQSNRGVGHEASPQPEHRPLRALPSSQVPRPGQRHEVHRQLRRGVPH